VRRLHVEAELSFDGPAGPGRVTADEAAIVVRVAGWRRLGHLALYLWRRAPAGRSPLALARTLSRSSGLPVYVDAGVGPRLRIASPRG
jgi:hypothetical protein